MSGPFRCFEKDFFFFLKDWFWGKRNEGEWREEGCSSLTSVN